MSEPATDDLLRETAKAIAAQLPAELLQRVIAAKLGEALASLTKSWGKNDLTSLAEAAVQEKANELLRTTYAKDVWELADKFARDALSLARHGCKVVRDQR